MSRTTAASFDRRKPITSRSITSAEESLRVRAAANTLLNDARREAALLAGRGVTSTASTSAPKVAGARRPPPAAFAMDAEDAERLRVYGVQPFIDEQLARHPPAHSVSSKHRNMSSHPGMRRHVSHALPAASAIPYLRNPPRGGYRHPSPATIAAARAGAARWRAAPVVGYRLTKPKSRIVPIKQGFTKHKGGWILDRSAVVHQGHKLRLRR